MSGAARTAWRDLGVVVGSGIAALAVVVLAARAAPAPERVPFDRKPLARLEKERPALVLLGNSMVYTRFEPELLNQLVAPTRVTTIAVAGSKSAIWYAQLKYYIVASGVRPRVALFFRNKELTQPRTNAEGGRAPKLQRCIRERDPVIERKAGREEKGVEAWSGALGEIVPVEHLRVAAWDPVDEAAMRLSSSLARGPSGTRRKDQINRLFAVEALRPGPEQTEERSEKPAPFSALVGRSFLPDILELARENAISLTFVRVKTRAHASGIPDAKDRVEYNDDLRAYVERRGARFLDLTANEWEVLDMYGGGDHIAVRQRATYTRRFVASYPGLFREPP